MADQNSGAIPAVIPNTIQQIIGIANLGMTFLGIYQQARAAWKATHPETPDDVWPPDHEIIARFAANMASADGAFADVEQRLLNRKGVERAALEALRVLQPTAVTPQMTAMAMSAEEQNAGSTDRAGDSGQGTDGAGVRGGEAGRASAAKKPRARKSSGESRAAKSAGSSRKRASRSGSGGRG